MGKIRIGIVGCGAATSRYYLPALKRHTGSLGSQCFVDLDPTRAEETAKQAGGGEVFRRHEDIVGKVDGVIIVLPHFLHFRVARDFLRAGTHVLCEKPVAESAAEVRELCETAKEFNASLCVNNTRRMFPSLRKVQELLSARSLGKLTSVKIVEGNTFAWPSATNFYVDPSVSAKGVMLDIGSHVLDTVCWWLGAKPRLLECRDDSYGGPESLTRLVAEADGCRVDILLNRLVDLDSRFEVVGAQGAVLGKLFEWDRIVVRDRTGRETVEKLPSDVKAYPEFVAPIVDNFIDVIKGRCRPLISGEDVLPSIELIEEAYGRRTRLAMPWDAFPSVIKNRGRKVLVTGATGFIGGRVVEALHLTKDAEVRAAVRQWSSAARLGRMPVEIASMDLQDRAGIERALDGVTDVVHCAKGPYEVTVDGTRALAEAALRKGVRRFVHLSTTEVYGDAAGSITEETPYQYTGNEYNRMKIDAEKVCWDVAAKGLPLTVLRPSIVYGPFSKNWTLYFARLFSQGLGGLHAYFGSGTCNLIYVDDLAQAILASLENPGAEKQAFNVVGPDRPTWRKYLEDYNVALGYPPIRIPKAWDAHWSILTTEPVRFAGKMAKNHAFGLVKALKERSMIAGRAMKSTEGAIKSTPSRPEIQLLQKQQVCSTDRFASVYGHSPSTGMAQGIAQTVAWLRQQGAGVESPGATL